MVKGVDVVEIYREVKTLEFTNMVVKVHFPELSDVERTQRMKVIHKTASDLVKDCFKKGIRL